jgi:hypothetical protein
VVPVLRHRMKFRTGFDGFGSDPESADNLDRATTEADRQDALVREFALLCAPRIDGHDGTFEAALRTIPRELQF